MVKISEKDFGCPLILGRATKIITQEKLQISILRNSENSTIGKCCPIVFI